MRKQPWCIGIVSALVVAAAAACRSMPARPVAAVRPPDGWCKAPWSGLLNETNLIRGWLTGSESVFVAFRQDLGLSGPLQDSVVLITDDDVCARASAATDRAIRAHRGLPATVYRVGSFYAVPDPAPGGSHWTAMWFFDSTLTTRRGSFGY